MANITTMANIPPIASPRAQPLVVCDEPERTRFLRSKKWTIIDIIKQYNIKFIGFTTVS